MFASDIESEAARREIPGVTLGRPRNASTSSASLGTSLRPGLVEVNGEVGTLSRTLGQTQPSSPVMNSSIPLERSGSSGNLYGAGAVASSAPFVIPVGAGYAGTTLAGNLPRMPSTTSLTSFASVPSVQSGLASPSSPSAASTLENISYDENPDRTLWRLRLSGLVDDRFLLLRSNVRQEIDKRKALRRGVVDYLPPLTSAAPLLAGIPDGKNLHDSGYASLHNGKSYVSREAPLKATPFQDLLSLWEDLEVETNRRTALGLVVPALPPPGSRGSRVVPDHTAAAAEGDKFDGKKETSGLPLKKAKEPANVSAWRARIVKLTDEQVEEVTADVYDEMTRRRDKTGPFLEPRLNLSDRRNEARKQLAKLPSSEVKMLWLVIHEHLKERKDLEVR
ncbi:hypothetical protein BC829DRAFT_3742 [Chytridium lagenaria]|nr:hypothetical protein BC829DRAFT_3742 [Chytridium lagenaria]